MVLVVNPNYKRQARLEKQAFEATVIINLVKDVRKVIPCIGGRKLHFMLQTELEAHQIKIGRDALFELLGAHSLLMSRCKKERAPQRLQGIAAAHPTPGKLSLTLAYQLRIEFPIAIPRSFFEQQP